MLIYVLSVLESPVCDLLVSYFLRETLIVWYTPGVSAAYHLSQVIAGGKLLGEDKPFKAVIVEARDFCNIQIYFIFLSGLTNVREQAQAQQVCCDEIGVNNNV